MNHTPQRSAPRGHSGLLRTGLSLALPLFAVAAAAQQAAEPAAKEAVVLLETFSVTSERDQGYVASNSISGTRSNTAIKDIPLNIQVFTNEFANDFLITNQIDLERYNAALVNGGADVHSSNPIQQAYNAFLFRGFVQNWGLRDGIRNYDPVDTQGLSRVEIVKGPAAPLYGLAYPGGVMNSITKDVEFRRNFTDLRFTLQSEGEYRATVDANYAGRAAVGEFGVRFNGTNAETQDHRAHSDGAVRFAQINLNWRPLRTTELKFLAEDGYREKTNGLGYFTTNEGLGNGAEIPLQVTHPNIPWDWNWATGNMRTADMRLYRGTVTHAVTDNLTLTAYMQYSRRINVDSEGWDANAGSAGTAASWDVGWSSAGGWFDTGWINPNTPNEYIKLSYHHRDWQNKMRGYGATGVYKHDFAGLKNTFTFGGAAWGEKFTTFKGTVPPTSTSFVIFPVRANISTQVPSGPPPDYFMDYAGAYQREDNSNDYYFASWHGAMWQNRLKLSAAVNRTNIKLVQWGSGVATVPTTTELAKNSPMAGVMFDVARGFSVFYVHSTSLFPTTDKNDFEVQMPPVVGKSNEAGVKLELLNGKVSGTVSVYQIEQTGGAQRDPNAVNRRKLQWDGMTPAQRAVAFPGVVSRDELTDRSGQRGDLVPGAVQESTGFEADLVFQPTRQWQIVCSYAHNQQEITKAINRASIGQSTTGHIKDQFAAVTRYSFTEGAVKGLSIGCGVQAAGRALQDYAGPGGAGRYSPRTLWVEAFGGYRFKAAGFNHSLQLNAKNLTKQEEFVGWKATGSASRIATERYQVPTKMVFALTYGLHF